MSFNETFNRYILKNFMRLLNRSSITEYFIKLKNKLAFIVNFIILKNIIWNFFVFKQRKQKFLK